MFDNLLKVSRATVGQSGVCARMVTEISRIGRSDVSHWATTRGCVATNRLCCSTDEIEPAECVVDRLCSTPILVVGLRLSGGHSGRCSPVAVDLTPRCADRVNRP